MKNVYTSWNLNLLADKMIEKIKENWTSPFCSPVVIFSDPKIEQWFKLHWLKNKKTSNSVLMNLKTVRLQQFLFDILKPDFPTEKLSSELLRDIIISKLTSKVDNEKYYFENLGASCNAPEIIKYLTDAISTDVGTKTEINKVRLYDFSQEITSLFMNYEDTCPDKLEDMLNQSEWQKQLYNDIFSAPLDTNHAGININGTSYLTLYQLEKLNRLNRNDKKETFNWDSKRPVFLFGFSGVGELYRNILSDFSQAHTLEIFIQTGDFPANSQHGTAAECEKTANSQQKTAKDCQNTAAISQNSGANSEFSTNQLVNKLAGFGKENLDLWANSTKVPATVFVIPTEAPPADNILHSVQKSILENAKITPVKFSENNSSLTLTAAPTKLREIENVHSKICKLLLQGNAQVGDILVVAPHIQDYKVAIEQVFDQNAQTDEEQNFPYIPYIIADYSGEKSLTAEALHVFFEILKKGYLCRSDVFALLRNYLSQTVRDIGEDELSAWSEWATQMHIYRDRDDSNDGKIHDWQKAKTRLLLSRLTKNPVKKNDDEDYLPYETIESSDDNSLHKFIQAIDELEEWTQFSQKDKLNSDDIEKIRTILKKWLYLENTIPTNLFNEALVFQNIMEEIDRQKMMTKAGEISGSTKTAELTVYKDCFFFALFDRSRSVALHSSKILSQGITFANFESNRVLSAKYVFFIGLDSNVFPGIDKKSDLDLRVKNDAEHKKCDETVPLKKNAFLCQLMSASEGFFISFINKDLQKDEDFFKSSVLTDLFDTIYLKEVANGEEKTVYERALKIDEDRDWSELFTSREFRNKNNFIKLQGKSVVTDDTFSEDAPVSGNAPVTADNANDANGTKDTKVLPDRVPIYKIRKFLSDPFQFMAEEKFNPNEDNSDEELLEFEPLVFDSITKSALSKAYVREFLEKDGNVTTKALKHQLKNQNILPDSFFGELALQGLDEDGKMKAEVIKSSIPNADKIIFDDKKALSLLIKQEIDGEEKEWNLTGSLVWYIFEESSTEITTLEINKGGNCLGGYVTALAMLASLKDAQNIDIKYSVKMNVITMQSAKNPIETKDAKITPKEAYALLQNIYYAMFVENYHICAPFSLVKDNIKTDDGKGFAEFKNKLDNGFSNSAWQYFAKKDMFDMDKDIGYSADNFTEEWAKAREHQKNLIVFLQ